MNFKLKVLPMLSTTICLIIAMVLALPHETMCAPLLITKKDFSITFPDGWSVLAYPGMPVNDSGFIVADTGSNEVAAYGQGQKMTSSLTAKQIVAIYTSASTIDFARTDSSEKKLGKYTFSTVGYKDTSVTGDPTSRIRLYVTTQGNYVFLAWVSYNTDTELTSVARMETALATLNITPIAGIRKRLTYRKDRSPATNFNIQGRAGDFPSNRIPNSPVFQRP